MKTGYGLTAAVLAAALLAGCAATQSGTSYTRDEARREMSVRMGVVESVRGVTIEGTKTPIGAGAGAVAGGIAGSTIGHGRGSAVGAVVGAVAGGLAGGAIEEAATKRNGVEITVKLDNGQMVAIVQEDDGTEFRPGERVRILAGTSGGSRVSR
jgi:outer membrane lipoprotein SlyB